MYGIWTLVLENGFGYGLDASICKDVVAWTTYVSHVGFALYVASSLQTLVI